MVPLHRSRRALSFERKTKHTRGRGLKGSSVCLASPGLSRLSQHGRVLVLGAVRGHREKTCAVQRLAKDREAVKRGSSESQTQVCLVKHRLVILTQGASPGLRLYGTSTPVCFHFTGANSSVKGVCIFWRTSLQSFGGLYGGHQCPPLPCTSYLCWF